MNYYFIDGHIDTILNFFRSDNYNFSDVNPDFHVDLPRLEKSGIKIQIFALFVEPKYKPDQVLKRTLQLIGKLYQLLEEIEKLKLIKNYKDIETLNRDNIGILLAIEGGDAIFDLNTLHVFHHLGIRLITLTWNNSNQLASGISNISTSKGVTTLGKRVIHEMNKLGIIVDVSHLAPASFWDVISISKKPVVASHSNARNICNHPRNLSDEQIQALAENRGLMGINFCPSFLNNSGKAEINDIIRHIDYIRDLVGINYIGLGSDYDGIKNTPHGLENIGKLPVLKTILEKNGFDPGEIQAVFQKNWLTLFREILGG